MARSLLWPAVSVVSTVAVAAVVLSDVAPRVRAAFVLWFLVVCPGMALVRLLRLRDRIAEWTLAVALSIVLAILISSVMLYAGKWSPVHGLAILAGTTLAATVADVARAVRERHRTGLDRDFDR
ncbi:MAG: hypothetical protein M3304_00670 [Actinomycetota bacterium]|nr:hypothetical protein [Actinomycetota bacterium]